MARGKKQSKSRPLRYPNGYGSVFQLSQPERRRKPFIVQIPNGQQTYKDKLGFVRTKYTYKTLGYAETWDDGDKMLREWHGTKIQGSKHLLSSSATFKEIYDEAWPRAVKNTGVSAISAYNSAYKKLKPLYNLPIREIRTATMQPILDAMQLLGLGTKTIWNVKYICLVVFNYAYENDIVHKNYAEFLDIEKAEPTKEKRVFTENEIKCLFANDTEPYVDTILIYIYTGLRLNELLSVKREDVYIEERYMIGGSKTEAGKNRIIPISRKIESYVKDWYDKGYEYLITNPDGEQFKSPVYDYVFRKLVKRFKFTGITNHCCRHTMATLLDNANVNKVAAQKILGHKGNDITESIYIHKDLEQLIKAIDMI